MLLIHSFWYITRVTLYVDRIIVISFIETVEITMVSALGLSLAEVFVERREFLRRIVGMQCVQMAFFASLGD